MRPSDSRKPRSARRNSLYAALRASIVCPHTMRVAGAFTASTAGDQR